MSDLRDKRGDDGLLHLNQRRRQTRAMNQHATTPPAVTRLKVMPPDTGRQAGMSVAILIEDGFDAESIDDQIAALGWDRMLIQPEVIDASAASYWDLIVVASNGKTSAIAPICAQVSRDARQRVLVISRNRDPQVIADALNAGADDYVIVPFDAAECRARMMALVHRSGVPSQPHSQLLWVEPLSRTIGVGSLHTMLSAREWTLLATLIEAEQMPVGAEQIAARLWGTTGRKATLASVVSRLRLRLRAHHIHGIEIMTIRGNGYAIRYDVVDSSLIEAIAHAGTLA